MCCLGDPQFNLSVVAGVLGNEYAVVSMGADRCNNFVVPAKQPKKEGISVPWHSVPCCDSLL